MTASDAHRAIEAVFRIEAPRLIAGLARVTRDVGRAEELAQDALVSALQQWPDEGVPRNPGAWLMQAAKHRALDWCKASEIAGGDFRHIGAQGNAEGDEQQRIKRCLNEISSHDVLRTVRDAAARSGGR